MKLRAEKVPCPWCGHAYSSVIGVVSTRRRRRCLQCKDTFPTIEILAKDGRHPHRRSHQPILKLIES